ncbi:MAG: saccharopine dehydrogenase NADP-binding domain-containing protein [Gammaproteobacteria bacterium]|nr:saccharopine dehydrogenase NADP-binding domain-containing protein [Gammaproteobacteria bacterium]
MRVTVLGAGLVGGAIARDLALEKGWAITAVDRAPQLLRALQAQAGIKTVLTDLSEPDALKAVIGDADLVVSAVPGGMGYETLRQIIDAGKNVVDISFFGEDPFELDGLAKQRGVTAVVDCGVAPGLSNVIAGYVHQSMERVDSYVCYVGGLPKVRSWPYEYQAVFSPRDVLEEFTRPARLVEHGELVVRSALSEVELIDFKGVGTLEAFNTDGLRSLARTMDIPFMKEKTMRYPGHANLVRAFRDSGFFGIDAIEVSGQMVKPIDVTAKLMFEQWRMAEDEEDLTVMQVMLDGLQDGKRVRHDFYMVDSYDKATHTTSMARTTGYTCAIVARQVLEGMFTRKGICPPEFVGATTGCYGHLLLELERRGIHVEEVVTEAAESSDERLVSVFQRQIA